MASHAAPKPASLPLADGSQGATVRLHPLLTGTSLAPPAFIERATGLTAGLRNLGIGVPREEWLRIPIVAFLVEHPTIGPVLIDTGLHSSVGVDGKGNLGFTGPLVFRGLDFSSDQAVPGQLRARGIDPTDVRFVLMTHMHLDHASAIIDFPGATVVLSGAEWEATDSRGGALNGYVRRQYDHAIDYRLLDFADPQTDSFATFGRGIDLFGDGSVHAVFTPGHTAGHVSYVLRLAGREALVAGDAIYAMRTLEESVMPWRTHDEHNFKRSLREIQLFAKGSPDALIIPGHDLGLWNTLDSVY
jgi:glyoxylase-like metal-dependent hydrolase (beta-lactamase superfamily II)